MMSNSTTSEVEKQIRERFGYLLVEIHTLLMDFILWNDISRYPDLSADPPGPSRATAIKRSTTNEFQVRHLYVPTEKAIILGLFVLLYEKGSDYPALRTLSNRLLDRKVFNLVPDLEKKLLDTKEFFEDKGLYERFRDNRNGFIAHIVSIQATQENQVEHDHIYRLVPKTVYLAELIEEALKLPSHYYSNQFQSRARELALYFSHSEPDDLLADLFQSRSLSTVEYNSKVDSFLSELRRRERAAR